MKYQLLLIFAILSVSLCAEVNWQLCGYDLGIMYQYAQKLQDEGKENLSSNLEFLLQTAHQAGIDCGVEFDIKGLEAIRQLNQDNNSTTCMQGITQIKQLAQKIQQDIKTFNILALQKDIATLLNLTSYTVIACENETTACRTDMYNIAQDVYKIETEMQNYSQYLPQIIGQVIDILQNIQKAETDCSNISFSSIATMFGVQDYQQCVQAVEQIEQTAIAIERDVKSFAVVKLEQDLKTLYNQTQYALSVCTSSYFQVPDILYRLI